MSAASVEAPKSERIQKIREYGRYSDDLMMGQRLLRWPIIESALSERLILLALLGSSVDVRI